MGPKESKNCQKPNQKNRIFDLLLYSPKDPVRATLGSWGAGHVHGFQEVQARGQVPWADPSPEGEPREAARPWNTIKNWVLSTFEQISQYIQQFLGSTKKPARRLREASGRSPEAPRRPTEAPGGLLGPLWDLLKPPGAFWGLPGASSALPRIPVIPWKPPGSLLGPPGGLSVEPKN